MQVMLPVVNNVARQMFHTVSVLLATDWQLFQLISRDSLLTNCSSWSKQGHQSQISELNQHRVRELLVNWVLPKWQSYWYSQLRIRRCLSLKPLP